ncbi:YcjF family protein [Leptothoe sp. PORK10 BA2]|uniref:YcjF family protein n=1 Tax=Leptothoe sp. PORK10 BA2 TaxID=3110254 RepID=UPI002B2002AA|nr:GTP-binding protein [Leptothoe sp. PORK10 BA2]
MAVLIVLGIMLWLTSTLGTLYAGLSNLNPWLAQAITTLVVVLMLGALGVVAYYGWLFLRPRRRPQPPPLPKTTNEAAVSHLQSLDQQLGQIEDEVARQALVERAKAVTHAFEQQRLHLVIVGSGSVGKTSLANALMGEMAGETAVTKGTTTRSQDYRVAIPAIDGEIILSDSPGLLDAGAPDQASRELATQADLLLYVVDNDLHRAQYEILMQLLAVGKRTLVVLNKTDLYADDEVELLLERLRQRVGQRMDLKDVVAIAAHPRDIPSPHIQPLIDRIIAILRAEGRDLIANNILLQSQRLSLEARQLIGQQRQQKADAIIDRYQWIGAGVLAATPLPVIDMLATAAVNTQMVVELGQVYGIAVSIEDARTLAISLAKTMGSLGLVKGALKLLTVGLQANLATAVAGKLLQGVSAAYLTRIAGKSFVDYFENQQEWGDGGIQAVVEKHYQLNRRDQILQQFIQQALASVRGTSP